MAGILCAGQVLAAVPTTGIMAGVKCAGSGAVSGVGQNSSVYNQAESCGLCDFVLIFINVANMIVALSGAMAVLMFVYAGVMYLTASMKPENANKAKDAIKATFIGLVIVFGAYTLINFIVITFIGGTQNMSALSSITKMGAWGVCTGYN